MEITKKSKGNIVIKIDFPPAPGYKGLTFFSDYRLHIGIAWFEVWQEANGVDTQDKLLHTFSQENYDEAVEAWLKCGLEWHYIRCRAVSVQDQIFCTTLRYPTFKWSAWDNDPDNGNHNAVCKLRNRHG